MYLQVNTSTPGRSGRSGPVAHLNTAIRRWGAIPTVGLCLFGSVLPVRAEIFATDDARLSAVSQSKTEMESGYASSSSSAAPAAPTVVTDPLTSNSDWLKLSNFSASLGASAWSGDFGSHSGTTISVQSFTGSYKKDDLRLSVTLPYTRIDTRGNIFIGLGATPLVIRSATTTARRVNDGLGDVTINGSYVLHVVPDAGLDLELLGALKAPTASSGSRLSTGKTDFSFGAEVLKSYGRFAPFASLVYRDFGSSAQYRLRDGAATSVGLSYVVARRWIADISYDYARSASRFISDSHELVSSTSYRFERTNVRLSAYVSTGLSSGAPAVSGGFSLRKTF